MSRTDLLRVGDIRLSVAIVLIMCPARSIYISVLDTADVLRAPGHAYERVACCFLMNIDTWFAFWNVLDPELGQLPQ